MNFIIIYIQILFHLIQIPVKGVCTENDEYLSALSPDNNYAYYTRRSTKQKVGMLTIGDGRGVYSIS